MILKIKFYFSVRTWTPIQSEGGLKSVYDINLSNKEDGPSILFGKKVLVILNIS
jgi:hypothetical protein